MQTGDFWQTVFKKGDSWCCYSDKMKIEKDGIVSTPRWRSGHCQICNIPCKFPDFEQDID